MPTPPANALSSTFQVGTYTSLTDTFTSVFDLNDGVTTTIMWNTLKMPQPEKVFVRSFNLRAPGERVTRFQYKNRHIQVSVSLRGASVQAILNTCHSLIAAIENPTYRLRIAQPNATQYTYATVVAVTHNIPADPQTLLAKALTNVQIDFECLPALLGDRVTLQNLVVNPGFEAPSGPGVVAFNDGFSNANAYTSSGAAPTVAAGVMTIPASTTVTFGSAAWGAINTWQVRFQWFAGSTINFCLHRTDGNNVLFAEIFTNTWSLNHTVAGTNHVLATAAPTTLAGNFYWAVLTQFPAQAGNAAYVQATLYNDSAGAIGSQVATLGPVATFDAVTALTGKMAIQTGTQTAPIGGAFSSVHAVSLFGPGNWQLGNFGTALASGAWEQNTSNTLTGGPVTSYGALRIDAPPTGAFNAQWQSGISGSIKQTGCPIAAAGNVIGLSTWVRSTGVAASCTQGLLINEFDSTGASLRQSSGIGSITGAIAAWTQITATYTTGANCAYVTVVCLALDNTSASANGTIWFDNVQVWNQTTTGQATMPYCELRFNQSPAQLMVSGLVGDLPAPALLAIGTFVNTAVTAQDTLTYLVARRDNVSQNGRLIGKGYLTGVSDHPVIDSNSYGGYYWIMGAAGSGTTETLDNLNSAVGNSLGTYYILARYLTKQLLANLPKVTVQGTLVEVAPNIAGLGVTTGAPIAGIVTATNTWTVVAPGQITVPPSPVTTQQDIAALQIQSSVTFGDTSGVSALSQVDWWAYVPTSGSLVYGVFGPANLSGYSPTWFWWYFDGIQAVTGKTPSVTGVTYNYGANYVSSGNIGTALPFPAQGIGASNTTSLSDPYLSLDPTQTVNGAAVNQLITSVHEAGAMGVLLPVHVELQYVPVYLYPR